MGLSGYSDFAGDIVFDGESLGGLAIDEGGRGVLRADIAVSDTSRAEIKKALVADAQYARGHVDHKAVVRGHAIANAVPIDKVRCPKARVAHEASVGGADEKQLRTLMCRGLSENDAIDLIIRGLLSPGGGRF